MKDHDYFDYFIEKELDLWSEADEFNEKKRLLDDECDDPVNVDHVLSLSKNRELIARGNRIYQTHVYNSELIRKNKERIAFLRAKTNNMMEQYKQDLQYKSSKVVVSKKQNSLNMNVSSQFHTETPNLNESKRENSIKQSNQSKYDKSNSILFLIAIVIFIILLSISS